MLNPYALGRSLDVADVLDFGDWRLILAFIDIVLNFGRCTLMLTCVDGYHSVTLIKTESFV